MSLATKKGKFGRTECADLNILERENRWCCHFRLLRFNVEPCNPTPIGWAGVAGWRTALRKRPPEGACKPSRKESCKGGTDLVLPFSGGRVLRPPTISQQKKAATQLVAADRLRFRTPIPTTSFSCGEESMHQKWPRVNHSARCEK